MLSEHQSASRRLATTTVDGGPHLPALPDLAALWESGAPEPDDPALLARLTGLERELSAYRRGLHERLDAATGELIMRYRAEPALALRALPVPRQRAGRAPRPAGG